ncbi:MAG: hypothetical protein R3301_08470 [Saprospiraceae bacterium]|nr:hypothetical protein [Saprospiraceae bacterium]
MNFRIISIQRNSQYELRYHPNMGRLTTYVTRIQKTFLGIPFQTLHKYRDTYYGEVKDCRDCRLSA